MAQSLSRILVHLVFSTKNREPFIESRVRGRVFDYIGGSLNALGCPSITVGGVDDHVHLLFGMSRTLPICKIAEEVKKESSKWAKEVVSPQFAWQNGYAVFSVSPSNSPQVKEYIVHQEEKHRKRSFQDELRALLRRNELEWDERYVWE